MDNVGNLIKLFREINAFPLKVLVHSKQSEKGVLNITLYWTIFVCRK